MDSVSAVFACRSSLYGTAVLSDPNNSEGQEDIECGATPGKTEVLLFTAAGKDSRRGNPNLAPERPISKPGGKILDKKDYLYPN
jgi:hypothetical protein